MGPDPRHVLMKLYLDDSLAAPKLAQLLTGAGHDVRLPTDVGLAGVDDVEHLTHAVQETRICLSRHGTALLKLHQLIGAAQGQHAGILVVDRYNDPARDLTHRGIVRAVGNLEAAGLPLADQFEVLNRWH
jgi:hypothetical protein